MSNESLDVWAAKLAAAVGLDETRRLVARYRKLARDPAGSAEDRAVARVQAAALSRVLGGRAAEGPGRPKP